MNIRSILQNVKLLATLGAILGTCGLVILFTLSTIFDSLINSQIVLKQNTRTYSLWQKNQFPVEMDYYLFNWTNPEELLDNSTKPHLVEMGPYRFRETKEKVDIVWHDNGTVSYRLVEKWYFDEEHSAGSLDDEVTTLNVIAVTTAGQAELVNYLMQKTMSVTLTKFQSLHVTKTVGELLFYGYADKFIDLGRSLKIPGVIVPPFDKFGWFYPRNGSIDFYGLFNIGTGEGDIPLGKINRWNGERRTPFYKGTCGRVTGSAGDFWPQHIKKDWISTFNADVCRDLFLYFDEEVSVKGIKAYKFIGNRRTMDNGSMNPENVCFCNGECVPSGLLNISSCKYELPLFVSFPHFYMADPFYLDKFDGIEPNKKKHELSVILEPRTGVPLDGAVRIQINLLMTPSKTINLFKDVPKLFFPMIWFEQKMTIPDALASDVRLLMSVPFVGRTVAIVMITCGALILVASLMVHLYKFYNSTLRDKELRKTHFNREELSLNDNGANVQIKAQSLA